MLPEFPDFLNDTKRQWKCDRVICLGDVTDNRVINYHEKNPDLESGHREYEEAREQLAILHKMFPNQDTLIGNHDSLPQRKARTAGIPSWFVRALNEVWGTPTWRWHPRFYTLKVDGVGYRHGDKGRGGMVRPALLNAQRNFCSIAQGHYHSLLQVIWEFNDTAGIFGMQTGCGQDWGRAEQEYSQRFDMKPAIGCGVVIDGKHAFVERMER
jgi:hypothetical protein